MPSPGGGSEIHPFENTVSMNYIVKHGVRGVCAVRDTGVNLTNK